MTATQITIVSILYAMGMLVTFRIVFLAFADRYERLGRREHIVCIHPLRTIPGTWAHYGLAIMGISLAWWPMVLALAVWKILFPSGVKTAYAKEQELQAALRKAKEEADASDRRIAELEKQVLAWVPREYNRSGGEAA